MSRVPGGRTRGAASRGQVAARPYSVSRDEALARKLQEEEEKMLKDDENVARQLQEELLNEQRESDAELARRLYEEDRQKAQHHPSRPAPRHISATPIRQLFEALFTNGGPEQDTNGADSSDENSGGENMAVSASGPLPSNTDGNRRGVGLRQYGRPRRGRFVVPSATSPTEPEAPQGQANRSPERPLRGRGRRPSNSSGEGDTLSNVQVNPSHVRYRAPPGRVILREGPRLRTVEPEDGPGSNNPQRHIPFQPGLPMSLIPPSLPEGEYDPDMMMVEPPHSDQERSREDDFVSIMRDPFLLMLMLMGRDPGFMVPDDIDTNDYESLWELAERVGEVKSHGMKEEDINRLPNRRFRKQASSSSDEECRVCLTAYKSGDPVTLLPCQHEYHKDCIREWLKRNASCPICRHAVNDCGTPV